MLRLPGDTHHHALMGSNGSGKTRAGVWHLSRRHYDVMPWVIFDIKRDDLIARIPIAQEIDINADPPSEPGIYVTRPHPRQQDEIAGMLTRIWEQTHTGVYFDEGYMIESREANDAYKLLLTQGRSLNIPTITLSQRPVWLNRFVLSEATFYQTFRLNDARDRKTLQMFMPDDASESLPAYHSWYYDSGEHELHVMAPVPDDAAILAAFLPPEPATVPEPETPRILVRAI